MFGVDMPIQSKLIFQIEIAKCNYETSFSFVFLHQLQDAASNGISIYLYLYEYMIKNIENTKCNMLKDKLKYLRTINIFS